LDLAYRFSASTIGEINAIEKEPTASYRVLRDDSRNAAKENDPLSATLVILLLSFTLRLLPLSSYYCCRAIIALEFLDSSSK
jgi:hypothetical protein